MKNAIIKKSQWFLAALVGLILTTGAVTVRANDETEPAGESNLLHVTLPANAQRVLPQSVPAEITQTLDKITAAGGGKFVKGESEVLVWAGSGYKKSNARAIISRLTGSLETAGWKYAVESEESGVSVFTALKDGASRRAVVGFHGTTDDALIFAAMEVLPSNAAGANNQGESNDQTGQSETVAAAPRNSGGGNIVGTWTNGTVSTLGDKNLTTGVVTSRGGSTFKYVFTADGRFEFIGLMQSTMYGCTTGLFNDKRGTYKMNGSEITLIPTKNFWRNTYSCSPSSNKERDYVLERETLTFRNKTDEYGKVYICLGNAKGETCYRREE